MLVRATEMSAKLHVGIKELKRIATPGEEFEVTDSRYTILAGKNRYKVVFVVPVESNDVPKKAAVRKKKEVEE